MGTHINRTARVGFGEYKEYKRWSYLGYWNMQQINGFGMLKHHHTRERYTGEFKDNKIEGWGEYQRIIKNKVLKAKGDRKACKGTEYILIWSKFATVDFEDISHQNVNPDNDIKYLKIEDSNESFLAFPRLEEVDFQGKYPKYKLRLITNYMGKLALIKRKGVDRYEAYFPEERKSMPMSRREVRKLPET